MYEQFYGLKRRPFQLMPDRQFLFPSTGHQRALSYLLYGLEQREGFVVITGDVGAGKTLLIQTLFAELVDRPLATARLAAANLDAQNVLPMVASAFKLPYEGRTKTALLQAIEAMLREDPTFRDGALLVVDEAQTLSQAALEELRILSNLEIDGQALIQLFLVGQAELRRVLADRAMTQLRQRVIASHHLGPLTVVETRDYVLHRLRAAGWDDTPHIEPAVLDAVHDWSGGIPRRINWVMDRLLLYGYLEERQQLALWDLQAVLEELDTELHDEFAPSGEAPSATAAEADRLSALEIRVSLLERAVHDQLDASSAAESRGPGRTEADSTLAELDHRLSRLEAYR